MFKVYGVGFRVKVPFVLWAYYTARNNQLILRPGDPEYEYKYSLVYTTAASNQEFPCTPPLWN